MPHQSLNHQVASPLDRFSIERLLGRGTQGTVHLAFDRKLKRRVALKRVLKKSPGSAPTEEAHAVSRLQHPSIVPLHDAFFDADADVLIFEFVAGETLAKRIKAASGPLPVAEALRIVSALLDGLEYAHSQGIVHCDVKPANVMLDQDGTPRLTDFGIARSRGASTPGEAANGTPSYMAPEISEGRSATPQSDIFSAGVLLYETLTGKPPVVGASVFETIHRIATEPFKPPSAGNELVDARLDQVVLRAIAKNPNDRYPSAAAFSLAIAQYLECAHASPEPIGTNPTLEFLLQRMRIKGDFPALGESISVINRIACSETESANALTAVILKDVSLTNKLLRMVNAVYYQQFGGSVSTVSRAVAILGFDSVRNSALSLILFEHLKDGTQANELRALVGCGYFASVIARALATETGWAKPEEASIAAMLHDIGRMLVTFYLFEEAQQISRHAKNAAIDENRAATEVIGISYAQLGMGVARSWGFPASLVDALQVHVKASGTRQAAPLNAISAFSNALARASSDEEMCAVAHKYNDVIGYSEKRLTALRSTCLERCAGDAASLGLSVTLPAAAETVRTVTPTVCAPPTIPGQLREATLPVSEDRAAILIAGMQDIAQTLAGEYDLLQALRIILETLYRGSRFGRVLLFTKAPGGARLICRIGFGADTDALLKERFSISLAPAKDIFYGALFKNADVWIQNTDSPKVAPFIPAWHTRRFAARSILLLPVASGERVLGLIYADSNECQAQEMAESELGLIRTLRSQAVLAIRQKERSA